MQRYPNESPIYRASIKHTFTSESSSASIVTFVFPLPPDSCVHAFSAVINGRVINGVVKGKAEAKADFDEAIARNKQAALLEQENVEGEPHTILITSLFVTSPLSVQGHAGKRQAR